MSHLQQTNFDNRELPPSRQQELFEMQQRQLSRQKQPQQDRYQYGDDRDNDLQNFDMNRLGNMSKDEALAFAKGPKTRYIVAIPLLLVAGFIFYILSALFATAKAGEDDENESVSGMVGVTDANLANEFLKIQMAARIMPSHQTEGNMLIMKALNGDAEWQGEYDGDFNDQITDDFFTTDKLQDYFPDLAFTESTVPQGNAKPFCLHLDWSTLTNKKILDRYYSVQDMPICQLAKNPKFRWQEQDPMDGIDFSLWRQHSNKVSSSSDCTSSQIPVQMTKGGYMCYGYEVIESLCIGVSFRIDDETATYGWTFQGGCFEDGKIANYKTATPGEQYSFDALDIEVREYNASLLDRADSAFSLSGFFGVLSTLCVLGAIACAGLLVYDAVKANKQSNGNDGQALDGDKVELADMGAQRDDRKLIQ